MSFNTEGSDFGIGDREGIDETVGSSVGSGWACVTATVPTLRVLCNDSDGLVDAAKK